MFRETESLDRASTSPRVGYKEWCENIVLPMSGRKKMIEEEDGHNSHYMIVRLVVDL